MFSFWKTKDLLNYFWACTVALCLALASKVSVAAEIGKGGVDMAESDHGWLALPTNTTGQDGCAAKMLYEIDHDHAGNNKGQLFFACRAISRGHPYATQVNSFHFTALKLEIGTNLAGGGTFNEAQLQNLGNTTSNGLTVNQTAQELGFSSAYNNKESTISGLNGSGASDCSALADDDISNTCLYHVNSATAVKIQADAADADMSGVTTLKANVTDVQLFDNYAADIGNVFDGSTPLDIEDGEGLKSCISHKSTTAYTARTALDVSEDTAWFLKLDSASASNCRSDTASDWFTNNCDTAVSAVTTGDTPSSLQRNNSTVIIGHIGATTMLNLEPMPQSVTVTYTTAVSNTTTDSNGTDCGYVEGGDIGF